MKRQIRIACLSAAVAVVAGGIQKVHAQTLVWDSSGAAGSGTPVPGSGSWDLTTPNWIENGVNVVWPNSSATPTTPVASAQFGNDTYNGGGNASATTNEIALAAPIEVNNIDFSTESDGTVDYIDDALGGTLQVDGNIIKSTPNGEISIQLTTPLALSSAAHTVAINDTPGGVPELAIDATISGSGSVTLNNGANGYAQWGTLVLNDDSPNFSGGFNVVDGALTANTSGALGTAMTVISSQGALEFGGNGTKQAQTLVVNTPIEISRNTYTGTNYNDYTDAVISSNTGSGNTLTLNNVIIDSTDARIAANTSTVILPNSLTVGPDVTNGTAVADFDGDYAGVVELNGNNTAFGAAGNSIEIMNGVELDAANDAALGGSGSNLILNGGTLHITSALLASNPSLATNFGGHTIVNGTVGTGVDVDQGLTFTVNGLTGGGVGMRGGGTLDFTGTNTFTGTPYYDGVDDGPGEGTETDTTATGVVNFEAGSNTTQKGLRIRSATVNVAGTLNVGGTYTSIGADSSGSNGTPDYGTVNIMGSGTVIENSGDDFNVSDNNNTHGTINLSGNGNLTVGGTLYIGKSSGAVGTITMNGTPSLDANSLVFVGQNDGTGVLTQNGGSITLTRNGNFTFVLNDGRGGTGAGSGTYNFNGGTFTSAGEVYVGEGANGNNATWNQTAGTAVLTNWLVFGREGGSGTMNLSGGSLTRTDNSGNIGDENGSQTSVGEGPKTSTLNVTGTGQFTVDTGELYFGNNSGSGVLNVGTQGMTNETASVTVYNWLAVGRNGTSKGVVNVYDGTLTQVTEPGATNYFDISGDGGSPTGTVNVYGGTLNSTQMLIGENGSGTATLNIYGGNVNLPNNTVLANANTVTGTLNLDGGTLTAFGFQANNGLLGEGAGSGKATFDFNGGTLVASTNNTTAFIGAKVTSVVSAGGAIINTNGFTDRINSVLTHDSTLSGADGGLTKQGAGTLTLGASNTYTGPTTISAGTLQYLDANENLSSLSIANGAALDLSGAGTITIASGLPNYLTDLQTGFANGAWNGTSSSGGAIDSAFAASHQGVGVGYSTSGSALTLRLTWFGDTNLDGTVTYAEINAITPMSSGGTWATGDFNYDGKVNADDFSLAFLGVEEANGRSITAVAPEPAGALVALPVIAGLMSRRRRRSM